MQSAATAGIRFGPVAGVVERADAGGVNAPTTLEAGPVTVTAQVSVTYTAD